MTLSLEAYHRNLRNVVQQLEQMMLVYEEMNLSEQAQKMQDLKHGLLHNPFQISVVGEFSRGKSTFINALLGKVLLPSSSKPTTTILNMITYGQTSNISLLYRDTSKPSEQISDEIFAKLVAPREPIPGDPQSEQEYDSKLQYLQSIQYANIQHPLPVLRDGVQIIDTPGTNDLDPAREQITNEIIPKSDAAILLLSATKILSESEISFLRDRLLASDIQKIFIVINFKDELKSDADIHKVMTYAEEHLRGILNEPKLFLVAAKQALNARRVAGGEQLPPTRMGPQTVWELERTGFLELESALSEFLEHDRGAVKLLRPIQRTKKSITDTLDNHIKFEKNTLTISVHDIHAKVKAFQPKLLKMKEMGQEALHNVDFHTNQEEAALLKWYETELQQIAAAGLYIFDEQRQLSPTEISRRVEDGIAPLERELHKIRQEKATALWRTVLDKSSASLNKEWTKLNADFGRLVQGDTEGTVAISLHMEKKANDLVIFDEIFEELEDAWANKTSTVLGKAAVGVGFVLTVAIGSVAHLLKAGFSWLFGEDPKIKLRQQLNEQFMTQRRQKVNGLRQEWRATGRLVREQLEATVRQSVQLLEEQLFSLQQNAGMEEAEIKKKLEILQRREAKLTNIFADLDGIERSLQSNSKGQEFIYESSIK